MSSPAPSPDLSGLDGLDLDALLSSLPALEEVEAELRRRSLLEFTTALVPGYLPGWVHEEVCARLEQFSADVAAGLEPRLMVLMPPRVGKSTLASICFPAWHLGHHPAHEVIQGSYGQDLSRKFSRRARGLVKDPLYQATFPTTSLSLESASVEQWETEGPAGTAKGGYKAVGAGSAVTGQGAHVLVLDDTTKNRQEAYSAAQRDKVWEWYTWDLESRLAPGGGVLLTQTRWHHDDLAGRLLERDGEQVEGEPHKPGAWTVVRYPAIAEEDEPHRKEGEALHPERYPADCAVYTKARQAPRVWSALYQQRPVAATGNLFNPDTFPRWTESSLPARFDEVLISVDSKLKETQTGSYVVIQTWGRQGPDCYLLSQVRGRWGLVQTLATLEQVCAKHPGARVLIEDKANGPSVIEVIRGRVPGVFGVSPKESKEARASAVTPACESGNVHLPASAHWLSEFVEELEAFPLHKSDDQVDCLTQALDSLILSSWGDLRAPTPKPRRRLIL